MIRYDATRRKLLAGVIELMRTCKDVGQRTAGQPPIVDPQARCDLCNVRLETGRLLVGSHGLGHKTHDDGRVEFWPYLAEDPADALYFLCRTCNRLLRRDPDGLLRRLCGDCNN
jgi:hypothetical protein